MKLVVSAIVALVFVSGAVAAGPPVGWSKTDMKTAIRGLGYPKPHMKKLGCRGVGTADSTGRYTLFHCLATYRHHRHRQFYIGGLGEGGWLCASKTATACSLLRRGFVTTAAVTADGSLSGAADLAARGWMTNHYGSYQATGFCKSSGSLTWRCGFSAATVTISMRQAKGGYVVSASQS